MNTIPIVLASDDKYLKYAIIAIQSIILSTDSKCKLDIYVLYENLSKRNISALKKLSLTNAVITAIRIDNLPENWKVYEKDYFSKAMYYRLLIPELLQKYDKIIYLDCDILVLGDLGELMDIDLGNKVIGAIPEYIDENLRKYLLSIGLVDAPYFNSGVLVINRETFINENVVNRCLDVLNSNEEYLYPDQDILNVVCKDIYYPLPSKWNVKPYYYFSGTSFICLEDNENYVRDLADPGIVHFTSGYKPWHYKELQYSKEWWKVVNTFFMYKPILLKSIAIDIYMEYYKYRIKRKIRSLIRGRILK